MSAPDTDLSSLTKTELLQLGQELGVEGLSSSMLKADIISALLAVM